MSLRRKLGNFWGFGRLLMRTLFVVGPRRIAPVTATVAMLQVAIYCRLVPVTWGSPWEMCISVKTVLWERQWRRIIFGQLEHADSMHLYFNMVSFVWKGVLLEKKMGSARFAGVLVLFIIQVGAVLMLMTSFFVSLLNDKSIYDVCSIGFSGVTFALKVLKNVQWHEVTSFPSWFVWLELVLIHIGAPISALLGHLAGVLVGFGYVYGIRSSSLLVPPFAARLVSGLLVALRAKALPSRWSAMIHAPCLSFDQAFNNGHWKSLLLYPLHAPSDLHAAYAVSSLMFVGFRYEKQLGTVKFALWTVTFTLATALFHCLSTCPLVPWSLLGISYIDGVHTYEMPYKCFTGLTAVLLALKVYLGEDAERICSRAPESVARCLGLRKERYLFLWFELPCSPLLGAVLEAAFLRITMPYLWAPGNAAGIVAGLLCSHISRIRTWTEAPRSPKPEAPSNAFCRI